jgi:hypothetical protein
MSRPMSVDFRTYGVAHTTIMRVWPAPRSPEARRCVRRHSPLPFSAAGGRPGAADRPTYADFIEVSVDLPSLTEGFQPGSDP